MKIFAFFVLLSSILSIPLDRRELSTLLRPIEQGLQFITKPLFRASSIPYSVAPIAPVLTEMHFLSDLGAKIRLATSPKFYERHVAFTGERSPTYGRFPAMNSVIKDKAILWDKPSNVLHYPDSESTGRLEFITKNSVMVDQYVHVGDGVYRKSESTVKRLVAHGSMLNGQYVIDHFHGTVNAKQ